MSRVAAPMAGNPVAPRAGLAPGMRAARAALMLAQRHAR